MFKYGVSITDPSVRKHGSASAPGPFESDGSASAPGPFESDGSSDEISELLFEVRFHTNGFPEKMVWVEEVPPSSAFCRKWQWALPDSRQRSTVKKKEREKGRCDAGLGLASGFVYLHSLAQRVGVG
jgi:hypothetical protein